MSYRRLFIWVEGPDDERFINGIIKPLFEDKYNLVLSVQYAKWPLKKRKRFLKSIKAMRADYIYARDINDAPCVPAKKQIIKDKLRNIDEDRVIVVTKEIESWYLAGLDDTSSKKLGICRLRNTDSITKEQFNSFIPKKFDSKIDFMREILRYFSIETAKQKNKSFGYFIQKHAC